MNRTRRFAAALLATLGLAFGAHGASTGSVDYTDVWWNAGESGWGAGLTMQGTIIFLTLFVQGADRAPVYFTSDMQPLPTAAFAPGQPIWGGSLYRSTGSYFGGAYDASIARATVVGNVTVRFASAGRCPVRRRSSSARLPPSSSGG